MFTQAHRHTPPVSQTRKHSIEWEKILASYKFDQALVKHTKDKERKKINIKEKKTLKIGRGIEPKQI